MGDYTHLRTYLILLLEGGEGKSVKHKSVSREFLPTLNSLVRVAFGRDSWTNTSLESGLGDRFVVMVVWAVMWTGRVAYYFSGGVCLEWYRLSFLQLAGDLPPVYRTTKFKILMNKM